MRQLAVGSASQVKVCGICTGMGHSMDMCPIMQEEGAEQVNMVGHALAPRRPFNPYSRIYNPGWRDHPNLSYGGNRQTNFVPNKQPGYQQQYQPRPPSPPSSGSSLEEMMKQLLANQQKADSERQDIRNQMNQMAKTINRLESQVQGKLPFQPELNPKNVSAMTLRSGKEIQEPKPVIPKDKDEEKIENELEREDSNGANPKQDKEKEILEVFHKVEINIPLLDTIKQVPKYAKFLRDLCANRKRLRGDERVIVGENVSAVLQRKFPPKCGDSGMFTIPCRIGNTVIRRAMLDLEASINVMPKSIYASLKLCPLKEIGIIIQLADRTNAYSDGLVEDVLEVFKTVGRDELEVALTKHLKLETTPEEEKLIQVLREHKKVIGWTIADIKGISPSICMHRIRLEEDAKLVRQTQRRLNPLMMEVVKKEILKLLDVGIIFAISDRSWVNPVQVVPKKSGVTVEANQTGELVPVRKPTGWRQCNIARRDYMSQVPLIFVKIFDVWGIDFMGPFSTSFGFAYILLVVDYVSKWVEAKATRTNDSKVIADFIRSNIFVRFGMPRTIVSDRETHFCNKIIAALFRKYGVLYRVSMSYHPQTNGQAEVSNREIKSILEKMVHPDRKDWSQQLENAL
ncbi:uncharacterized protein [Coffea arabica]|uniref:Integrase catalytic domain-containing protein n=1 Tax=Coffea arabica TaxID=13443 RepID=A0ABM4VGS0_COFAR